MRSAIVAGMVVLAGCSGQVSAQDNGTPCYGTFAQSSHECTSDWSGIDKVSEAPEGATKTDPYCKCPEYTACFNIGDGLVACALVAGQ